MEHVNLCYDERHGLFIPWQISIEYVCDYNVSSVSTDIIYCIFEYIEWNIYESFRIIVKLHDENYTKPDKFYFTT